MVKFFITLVLLFLPHLCFALPVLVQDSVASETATTSFSSNVTVGNVIMVFYQDGNNGGTVDEPTGFGDNLGNTYVKALGGIPSGSTTSWIYYTVVTTGGSCTVFVTQGANSTDPGLHAQEVSGIDTGSPLITTSSGIGTSGTTYSGTSFTLSQNSGYLFSGWGNEKVAGTFIAGTGYTLGTVLSGHYSAEQYQIFSAPGTYTLTATGPDTGGSGWVIVGAAFKSAGGGSTGHYNQLMGSSTIRGNSSFN